MKNPKLLVPSVTPILAKYRGPSSSKDYNSFFRAAYNDIVTAYQALQQQFKDAQLTNEILVQQYKALSQQLAQAEGQLIGLTQSFANLKALKANATTITQASAGTITLTQTFYSGQVSYGGFLSYYPTTSPLSVDQRAEFSPQYGQILPHFSLSPLSKTYLVDLITNNIVLPAGVMTVNPSQSVPSYTPYLVDENDPQQAVDGDETTFYRRNVYFPSARNVQQVSTDFIVTLPAQFINNLNCNYVTIHPYPEYGVSITSVILHGPPGTPDKQVLSLDGAGNIIPIIAAGKTRIVFPESQVVSMTVSMAQLQSDISLQPGLQAFPVGAAIIDIGYITFSQSSSRVLVPFSLTNNFFKYVTYVGPTVNGANFNLYFLNGSGDLQKANIGDFLPGFVNTVYVEVVLTPALGIIPVINQLQLQFVPVYNLS